MQRTRDDASTELLSTTFIDGSGDARDASIERVQRRAFRPRFLRAGSGMLAVVRRWLADEAGAASVEYLVLTVTCGLLAAIGLIGAVGPGLVSMWSERRGCLYDDACGPRRESRAPDARAEPLPMQNGAR